MLRSQREAERAAARQSQRGVTAPTRKPRKRTRNIDLLEVASLNNEIAHRKLALQNLLEDGLQLTRRSFLNSSVPNYRRSKYQRNLPIQPAPPTRNQYRVPDLSFFQSLVLGGKSQISTGSPESRGALYLGSATTPTSGIGAEKQDRRVAK